MESRVYRCVSEAIAEANQFRPEDAQIPAEVDTILVGEDAVLDSLSMVNLAVALEGAIEREFGEAVGIVGDLLGSADPSAFRTVGLLTEFVAARIPSSAS